jgi:hypothetical protein
MNEDISRTTADAMTLMDRKKPFVVMADKLRDVIRSKYVSVVLQYVDTGKRNASVFHGVHHIRSI